MIGWGCITSPGSAAAIIRDQRKKRAAAAVTASYLLCSKLPDDMITKMLSRLPAHKIMELRYVCKHWLALTSTQSFRELHFRNQSPMDLFVAQYTSYATDLSVSPLLTNSFEFLAISKKPTDWDDGRFKRSRGRFERSRIGITAYTSTPLQLCEPLLISSYRGFLVFKHYSNEDDLVLSFYNPMTRVQVTVAAPASRYVYCGFYFHSPTKEFRVLYQVLIDDHDDEQDAGLNGFAILGLSTKSLRRIKNFPHCPSSSSAPPIILNGALYWIVSETHVHGHPSCSETILSFGTESEEFHVMPHPGDKCVVSSGGGGGHDTHDTYYMNLMDVDGQLCLRVVGESSDPYNKLLEIWILEDYKEWIWVKIHVKVEWLNWLFYNFDVGLPRTFNVLCMHNGEVMHDYVKKMKYYKRRYYCHLHNLKNGNIRRLETTCLERGKKFGNMMAVHPSLLSLHNENFGYVLYLHEDQSVEERGDLDKVCQVVETYRKQSSLSIIKQKFLKWKKL